MADETNGSTGEGASPDPSSSNAPTSRAVVPVWKQRNFLIGAGAVVVILLAAIVAVAASGGGDDAPVADSTTAPTSTTVTTAPGDEPPIAPLTGLADESLVTLIQPALIAKIDNISLSQRPDQAGIELADVVWEEPVEGTTRLFAVWHSQIPERAGPIRSTRLLDAGIGWSFGEVPYIYSGGAADKVVAINETPLQTFDESGLASLGASFRDPNSRAPHNLFADIAKVWGAASDRTPPDPLFRYLDDGEKFVGFPALRVEIPNDNRATYTWDEQSGTWLRDQLRSGSIQPHMTESGEQVAPVNVIVQRINGVGRDDVVGDGAAWVFTDGQLAIGRWQREALDDRTVFALEDGREIELTPGSTWVHLILDGEPTIDTGEGAESSG